MKIHELTDLKDTSNVLTLDDERGLDNMDWSEDGQLLAVSTSKVGGGEHCCQLAENSAKFLSKGPNRGILLARRPPFLA